MYMRDTMHQIDLGVIISFMKAILRKYLECVEKILNIHGAAAKKITERLSRMQVKTMTANGLIICGQNDCLVPMNKSITSVFNQLYSKNKATSHVRACDYRHLLLLLPFILQHLFRNEVEQFNQLRAGNPPVIDPSSELVDVSNSFLSWYTLFRRVTPPKTTNDVLTLQTLSHRYALSLRL